MSSGAPLPYTARDFGLRNSYLYHDSCSWKRTGERFDTTRRVECQAQLRHNLRMEVAPSQGRSEGILWLWETDGWYSMDKKRPTAINLDDVVMKEQTLRTLAVF